MTARSWTLWGPDNRVRWSSCIVRWCWYKHFIKRRLSVVRSPDQYQRSVCFNRLFSLPNHRWVIFIDIRTRPLTRHMQDLSDALTVCRGRKPGTTFVQKMLRWAMSHFIWHPLFEMNICFPQTCQSEKSYNLLRLRAQHRTHRLSQRASEFHAYSDENGWISAYLGHRLQEERRLHSEWVFRAHLFLDYAITIFRHCAASDKPDLYINSQQGKA